jgi:hypothetical protein
MHSFLFSPPTSPTAIQASHSPLLEPVESFNALNRLLSPRVGGSSTFQAGPELGSKGSTSREERDGPGGFVSTRSYPSRSVSPIDLSVSVGHNLPPFPSSSSSSYQARPSAPALSRHNSFSNTAPPNVPTDFGLPPPATQRDALLALRKNWKHAPRPKALVRLILVALLVLGGISLVFRSSSPLLSTMKSDNTSAPLTPQQPVDIGAISLVGGKKVRVTGQWGAPRILTSSEEQPAVGEYIGERRRSPFANLILD